MSTFQNDFFEKREINGINMYIIPAGTTLYRGDSNFTDIKDKDLLKGQYKFFTTDPEYADKYGIVFEFKTNKHLQLITLDDISRDFFVNAPEHIQVILEDNYGYSNHKRDSVYKKDYLVSQYICEQGYQGYAANTMKHVVDIEDDLDPEVIICNAEEHLERIQRITKESKILFKRDELNMRRVGKKRERPIKDMKDRPTPMSSLLWDDEDEYEEFQPAKRLFGGKTKKAKKAKKVKKQTKKNKSKTKRKSIKSKTNKK